MRRRLAKYVLVGYLIKALVLVIITLLIPEWPEWAGAKARTLWLSARPGQQRSQTGGENPTRPGEPDRPDRIDAEPVAAQAPAAVER